MNLFKALVLTVVIEEILALLIGFRGKELLLVLLVNILTNPTINVIIQQIPRYFYSIHYAKILAVLELSVIGIEGFIYDKYLRRIKFNYMLYSFIMNFCSFLFGIFFREIFL